MTGWAIQLTIDGGQRDGRYLAYEIVEDLAQLPAIVHKRNALEVKAVRIRSDSMAEAVFRAASEQPRPNPNAGSI